MSVENNKLGLDLDKAKVLKVIGTGTVGSFVNKVLSKTDIDIFKVSNKKMIIDCNIEDRSELPHSINESV
jgi:hypothetical protein